MPHPAGVNQAISPPGVDHLGPCRHQFVADARKELLDRQPAAREQNMQMTGLRQALARHRRLGKAVALDQRHALEMIRQHAAGEQPGDAAADDDGMRISPDRAFAFLIPFNVSRRKGS